MPLVPHFVQRIASWFVHWMTSGQDPAEIAARASRRFPDLPETTLETAAQEAGRAIRTAEVAAALPPTEPLQSALEGEEPPDPRVGVRFTYHLFLRDGRDYWFTVKVPGEWSLTLDEATQRAADQAAQIISRYPGSRVEHVILEPPLRWPLPEQL